MVLRYFDPRTHEWFTQDLIRWDAGDYNLDRYVFNNATNATDPDGRDLFWITKDNDTAKHNGNTFLPLSRSGFGNRLVYLGKMKDPRKEGNTNIPVNLYLVQWGWDVKQSNVDEAKEALSGSNYASADKVLEAVEDGFETFATDRVIYEKNLSGFSYMNPPVPGDGQVLRPNLSNWSVEPFYLSNMTEGQRVLTFLSDAQIFGGAKALKGVLNSDRYYLFGPQIGVWGWEIEAVEPGKSDFDGLFDSHIVDAMSRESGYASAYDALDKGLPKAVGEFKAQIAERVLVNVGALALVRVGSGVYKWVKRSKGNLDARVAQAIAKGEVKVTNKVGAGAARPPQHHIFPQNEADRAWFKERGINVDNYAVTLDEGTHRALHWGGGPGKGGGWWNETIMKNLKEREAVLRRHLTPAEIEAAGLEMRKRAKIDNLPVVPYERP